MSHTETQTSIAGAYPELVGQLADPAMADADISQWVTWRCGDPQHKPFRAKATDVHDGSRCCLPCRTNDTFYRQHQPGTLMAGNSTATALEKELVSELKLLLPGEDIRGLRGIVLSPADAPALGKKITPDIVFPRRKVVVELDGGNGISGTYSRHDTPTGALMDSHRDRALAALGWSTVRLRHPNALSLTDSPAAVLESSSKSARVLAALLVAHLRCWDSEHPGK